MLNSADQSTKNVATQHFIFHIKIWKRFRMNILERQIIATLITTLVGMSLLAAAFWIGVFAVQHGIPWAFAASFIIAIVAFVSVEVYVVKRLLVDYW